MSRRWRKQSAFERLGVLAAQKDDGEGLVEWANRLMKDTPAAAELWDLEVARSIRRGVAPKNARLEVFMAYAMAWWVMYGRREFVISVEDAGLLVDGYRRALETEEGKAFHRDRWTDCMGWLIREEGGGQELISFLVRPFMKRWEGEDDYTSEVCSMSVEPDGPGAMVNVARYDTSPDSVLLGCAIAYALDTDRAEVEERTYTGRGARPRVLRRKQRTTNPERIIRLKGDPPRRVFTRTVGAPTTVGHPGPIRPAVAREVPAGHQGKWVLSPRVGEEVLEIREREGKSPLHLVVRPRRAYRTSGAPPRPARLRLEGA